MVSERSPSPIGRRALLGALVSSGVTGVAGCTAPEGDVEGDGDAPLADLDVPPGTWPMSHYDPPGTGHLPETNGPPPGTEPRVLQDVPTVNRQLAVDHDRVYVHQIDGVYAIGRDDGQIHWQFQSRPSQVEGLIALDDRVYTTNADGSVYGLEAESGSIDWQYDVDESVLQATPVTNGSVVYVATTAAVIALDADSGERFWRRRILQTRNHIPSGLAYAAGRLYVSASSRGEGAVYALDARTGSIDWEADVGASHMAPVVDTASGVVYAGTASGQLYALQVDSGNVRWQTRSRDHTLMIRPAVADGAVYVPSHSDHHLRALSAEDGSLSWRFETGPSFASPVVLDGTILVGTGSRDCYWLDRDGAERGHTTVGRPVSSISVVDETAVVVGSAMHDGQVSVLSATTDDSS